MVTRTSNVPVACLGALFLWGCGDDLSTWPVYSDELKLGFDESGGVSLRSGDSQDLEIDGRWYVSGDAYEAPASCVNVGQHPPDQCANVTRPIPAAGTPANVGGKVCVSGTVEQVLPVGTGVQLDTQTASDFSTMWGAGIGLDWKLKYETAERDPRKREVWDASERQGIAFDLDMPPDRNTPSQAKPENLRVEFIFQVDHSVELPPNRGTVLLDGTIIHPNNLGVSALCNSGGPCVTSDGRTVWNGAMPNVWTSEEHSHGSPFYRKPEDERFDQFVDPTPVVEGHNRIHFVDVYRPPQLLGAPYPTLDTHKLIGIQFHIPASIGGARPFGFCISNLAVF